MGHSGKGTQRATFQRHLTDSEYPSQYPWLHNDLTRHRAEQTPGRLTADLKGIRIRGEKGGSLMLLLYSDQNVLLEVVETYVGPEE